MKVIYSNEPTIDYYLPNSLFLAGPTPRTPDVLSWRPKAIEILSSIFDGTVFVPEPSNGEKFISYDFQVNWELSSLEHCGIVMFWIPRNMVNMPALTTNTEFGYWLAKSPERVIYGRPIDAQKCNYLDFLYERDTGRIPLSTLEETISLSIDSLKGL